MNKSALFEYRWGSGWIGEQFAGKEESTYDNNKVETDVRCTIGGPPTGVGYWPPLVTKKVKVVEKVPVWGWKRVEYDVENARIKTRLEFACPSELLLRLQRLTIVAININRRMNTMICWKVT